MIDEPRVFEGLRSTLTTDRRRPHVVGAGPFALDIDARDTRGASIDVSDLWAQRPRKNRDQLQEVHLLTGSRFVRRFAELGDTMRIYTDGAAFDEALQLVIQR